MGGIDDQYEEDFGMEGSNPGLAGSMPRSSLPSDIAMNDPPRGVQDLKSVPGAHSDRLEESMPQESDFINGSSPGKPESSFK